MADHIRAVAPEGAACQLPSLPGVGKSTRSALQTRFAGVQQQPGAPAMSLINDDASAFEQPTAAGPHDSVFVRVLHSRPASWKLLPVVNIFGKRLSARAIAVMPLHSFC
eukprot:4607485-Alexandrium_andersonii.AAC.1